MKLKRALAVLMVAIMLVVPFSAVSSAANNYIIISGPIKTNYTDCEYFVPQGIAITDGSEIILYSPTDEKWSFDPAINELLTVGVNEIGEDVNDVKVRVFYDNKYIGDVDVHVEHILGEITFIGQAGHGQYCLGCGKVHNFEEHNVPEYIPNDDGGLFIMQTETGTCEDCHGKITRNIENSEKFLTIFGNLSPVESEIIGYLNSILVTLIQMLAGIA